MFYYTCDNCHYTFGSERKEYLCPECRETSINHKFGSAKIKISALRQANDKEIDLYEAQMGADNEKNVVTTDTPLILFRNMESSGMLFAKIGKSKDCNYVKGEKYPYEIGLTPYRPSNSFTFEPINIVYNYIHYGDTLVIFSFDQMWEKHRSDVLDILAISVNSNYKGCFQANMLYVTEITPLNSERAIDLIVPHLSEDDIDSILVRFYSKGEEYYATTVYLEKQLRKRFPMVTKQHTLSGDVECDRGLVFWRKKYKKQTINIDYIQYKTLSQIFYGNTMPFSHDPIEIEGVQYTNVTLDQN